MEIGLFQLENLILARVVFVLLDLRAAGACSWPEEVSRCLSGSVKVEPRHVREYLELNQVKKDSPFVLFCEDGKKSREVAAELTAIGYSNVYVVIDGLEGLLSELT